MINGENITAFMDTPPGSAEEALAKREYLGRHKSAHDAIQFLASRGERCSVMARFPVNRITRTRLERNGFRVLGGELCQK